MGETIHADGLITRRRLLYIATGVAAAGVVTAARLGRGGETTTTTNSGTGELPKPNGQGGGAEVVDTRKKFHEIIGGLNSSQHPKLAQNINTAIGLPPATSLDTRRIILPQAASSLLAARFNNVDYGRAKPGRELNLSVLMEKELPSGKLSDAMLRPHRTAGVQPQRHSDLPGHLLFYDPNAQPGYSNPGRLTVLREHQPEYILDMALTEFGHDASQHSAVTGGYELAVGVAKEFQRLLG